MSEYKKKPMEGTEEQDYNKEKTGYQGDKNTKRDWEKKEQKGTNGEYKNPKHGEKGHRHNETDEKHEEEKW